MIQPQRAPVRPRVISSEGESYPLEEELQRFLKSDTSGVVAVLGLVGWGKTTALRHLAAAFPANSRIQLLDDPTIDAAFAGAVTGNLVVYTATAALPDDHLAIFHLAPWGEDELIEYLLTVHKDRCGSVMARLHHEDILRFDGLPDVWKIVLDQLAADESIPDARRALHRHLETQLADTDLLERACSACLNALAEAATNEPVGIWQLARPGFEKELIRLLRHRAVQLMLATERVTADLCGGADCDFLALRLPRDLVQRAAADLNGDGHALDHLRQLLAGPSWSHAMTASILHAMDRKWLPMLGLPFNLRGAYLEHAFWPAVRMEGCDLSRADLSGGDLREAVLHSLIAHGTDFRRAHLRDASLPGADFTKANLNGADLAQVCAECACFDGGFLHGVNLESSRLNKASFRDANLCDAGFQEADLTSVILEGADIRGADFSGANLRAASLSGLRLREARLTGACLAEARLNDCDLEGMELPGADFQGADLQGALLTGTIMPNAHFTGAHLAGAKMAEIEWEGACLRGADLRGATFHMGSSRSGLVFSPIACEGSRTGFYTDDFDEQYFKSPEEIRKANLCGADLRGALIDDVDFYLVDLRGASYDAGQEEHLRRCGAILEARV